MRLAVFTSEFPGRVSTFFARDMRALLAAGLEIEIFAIYPLNKALWRFVPDELNEQCFPRTQVHHWGHIEGLRFIRSTEARKLGSMISDVAAIGCSAVRYGVMPLLKSMYVIPKAWAWASQNPQQFDHVLSYWGNYAATCAYCFHRLLKRQVPFSMFLHAGTDLYRQQVFLKQKLLYADNVIVVADFNRQFVRKLYPEVFPELDSKFYLHYLGLDLATLQFSGGGRLRNRVLGVGRHARGKGFDYLLRAAGELVVRGHDLTVELVGDGPETKSLKRLAVELGLSTKVVFSGWLPFEQVCHRMRQATMLVHPSASIGDCTPTVCKEAMALGTPVIASSVAGIPEILDQGNAGALVPPQDVPALASTIERMLLDGSLRERFARSGRLFAEKTFDLWKNGAALAARLLATQRGPGH